jgi:branched-chain amino acid transport system substrate-binding protein
MVLPMSGPSQPTASRSSTAPASTCNNQGSFAGRKVELIVKRRHRHRPEISKRAAQELVVDGQVDVLAGFGLTLVGSSRRAAIATEAKKPMIVMNAAASVITTKSNYILRVSHTLPQITAPIAGWAAKNRIKRVYTLVADYGPGHDAEAQFKKPLPPPAAVIGEVRTPVKNPDFAPSCRKSKMPSRVACRRPPGEQTAFMKGFAERDLAKNGIRIVATGDLTGRGRRRRRQRAGHRHLAAVFRCTTRPKTRPIPRSTKGLPQGPPQLHVGQRLRRDAIDRQNAGQDRRRRQRRHLRRGGQGARPTSPRGPISIDPETRDIVQTIYIRRVERSPANSRTSSSTRSPTSRTPASPGLNPARPGWLCVRPGFRSRSQRRSP